MFSMAMVLASMLASRCGGGGWLEEDVCVSEAGGLGT